jgi:hypothetical protein
MVKSYLLMDSLVELIDEPARSGCRQLLSEQHQLFQSAFGSSHNHQAWPGGYFDHVQEVLNLAVVLYEALAPLRPLPFSLSDALLVLLLHDLEKPWAYEANEQGRPQRKAAFASKEAQFDQIFIEISEASTGIRPLGHAFLTRLEERPIMLLVDLVSNTMNLSDNPHRNNYSLPT